MKNTYITAIIGIVFLFSSIGCRNDETELTNQSVRSIQFTEEKIRLKAGEQVTVRLNIDPAEAKNNTTVQYRASTNGYIDISNASNDGCIIKALKGGSVILIAESGKYTAYLEIEIDMQESVPYIIIPMQVIELNEGAMKSVQVSLYNGSALDNHAFEWTTETGKDNISIFATANTVVVKGEKRGSQKIIVRHEKTQFEGEILIFVIGVDEVPRYITSASNVLVMETGGVNRQFNVSLVNGKETDKAGFTFNVIEGDGVVNILTSNETCNVLPVKNGTALIRARHPLAEYPLDIRVIVVLGNEPVISLDKTFLLMNNNSTDFITARIEGNHQVQWLNDFEYTLSDSDVIDITKTNNSLFITAKKPGSCVIAIRNRHITYSREALIIVRSEKEIVPDDYYITTSQNVLQLEVGQKLPTQLTMQLVGGIEADKNLFTWVVDDGTIIDVESAYGTVQYARGIIARSIITDVFSAAAIITPKKTGLAKITLIHPKSSVTASVIVKVYPRGTFSGVPFILGNNEGGLIRVDTTKADKRVVLHMVSGNETELGPLVWEIENTNIASVSALTGLENEIHGITRGTTKLIVNNNNLKYPYEALVMAGTTEELARMNVLYTDNVYQTVAVGQSISVQIKDSSDLLSQDFNFSVSVQGANTVNAVMIKSRLLLQGMDEGSARVVISHPQAENTVTIYVQTEPGAISIDKPYTITGPSFVGMYYGQKLDSSVQMNGAAPIELDRIKWHSQDNSIVSVTGNGPMAKIEAGTTTGQTNITVTHTKSMNEKNIVYYVVPTAADLASSVVLGIAKENWLVKTGDELLLKLVTNATDDQKKGIVWGGFDISVVHVDFNGDSAFVRATGEGNTAITVHHPQNVIPLKIYISVGNIPPETKSISLPSIIEMIIGENKIIKADTTGLTINEKAAIQWSIEDDSIAAISNDGEQSFILGKKKGQTYINVTQTAIGFQKRILLVCAASYEELQNTYVMAAPETFYRLKTGEQRNITLLFGQAGFPEAEKQNITWKEGGNNVLALYPNGDKLQFEGKNEGISKITATHPLAFSSVVITVEVYKETIPGIDYRFEYEAMKGMVVGSSAVITIMLTPNGAINGQLTFENENDSTASVIQTGAGNEFYVTALQKGQTYLTVRHPLALDPARILIYTANTEAELQMMFPISLAKPNYLLTIGGKSETIKIETPNDDPAKLALISWSPDDTSIVDYTIKSKKEIEITGKKEGNCTFSIRYNNVVVEKAYISVKAAGNIDFSKRIATESIIGIMRGEKRQTIIAHNLTGNEAALLEWETHNPAVARVMPIAGDRSKAEIEAIGSGETEIVVSLGQIKRYIKVYVCDTETEIMAYKALNIDCRYYQIRRNDEITLTAYHAAANTASSDTWIHSPYDANVVSITANGKNKAQIKGINEGIAAILLENIECATPVMIMVEVSNTAPSVTENTDGWFLTTSKTVYALDPQKTTELTRITVTPVKFNEAEIPKIKWQIISGSNLISMYSNGGVFCDVAPNGGSGTAVIRAEHPKSANYIDITIICSVDPIPDDGTPFITSSEEVVRLANGSEKQITMYLVNVHNPDIGQFTASVDNGNAEASMTGNLLTIKAKSHGQSMITVSHPSSYISKKIISLVTTNDSGIMYLTTMHNFTVIEQNNYKAVSVELVGFEEVNNHNFRWSADTDSDGELVQINSSGKSAVITGKNIGTAKIKIQHEYCEYPLYMYVRVTQTAQTNPVYITTSNNIVSVKAGNSIQIKSTLINGPAHELSLFSWGTSDRHLIELNYAGDTAMIRGIMPGTAGITISHPASLNAITILVVVEPEDVNNGIYITSDNVLIEMKPGDSARQIRVRLIGGNPEDIYGFQWSVVNYVSINKKPVTGESLPVIAISANADLCFVSGTRERTEGEATIRVSHPKTSYKLDIKVIVMETMDIHFARKNITMDMLSSQAIDVTAPTGQTIIYESSDESIAAAAGTNKVCVIEAKKEGTVIIRAYNTSGTKSDEMIVRVNKIDTETLEYIHVDRTLLTLVMGMAPVVVRGEVRKAKTEEKDSSIGQYLRWTSQNTDIVRVSPAEGESIVIMPVGSGETEITVAYNYANNPNDRDCANHPSLRTYIRKIYIKVTMTDSTFVISDQAIRLAEGSDITIWARVDNAANIDYSTDVHWSTDRPDVISVDKLASTTNSLVNIHAKKAGTAQVKAEFRGSIQYCTVIVTRQKVLSVNATQINIQPNVTLPNPQEPTEYVITLIGDEGEEVLYNVDTYNYAEIEISPIAYEQTNAGQRAIYGNGSKITVTGKDLEGTTTLTLTAKLSGLRTTITIFTVKNYYIAWKNRMQIRAEPYISDADKNNVNSDKRAMYIVEFDINPKNDILEVIGSEWKDIADIHIDNDNNRIYVWPIKAGYRLIRFNGKQSGIVRELPVYFFYPKINIEWIWSKRNNNSNTIPVMNLHSRIDEAQGAAYLADGEELWLHPNYEKLEAEYPGNGLVLYEIIPKWANNNNISKSPNMIIPDNSKVVINLEKSGIPQNALNDQVVDIQYRGHFAIRYGFPNGGETVTMFFKNYLLYLETWRRIP